jgi:hypothetical protein
MRTTHDSDEPRNLVGLTSDLSWVRGSMREALYESHGMTRLVVYVGKVKCEEGHLET